MTASGKTGAGEIRAGMGGWTFEPWDTSFYPDRLAKAKQLHYASRQVPTIEVNGTYYSTFKPATFAKWAGDTPEGFVFSLKAIRFSTNRRVLAEAGESVGRFLGSGVSELGDKLGPILWQFAPTKKFDPDDFGAFLELLPEKQDGVPLRHAVEVRNDSFVVSEFVALLRKHDVAVVYADHEKYPAIADVTSDFVYARLQTGADDIPTCYPEKALDDLPLADPATHAEVKPRDVFVYFITSGKVRAPHGAMAFMERV
jgi:uncharacterized protein YecE (DUF72 family)